MPLVAGKVIFGRVAPPVAAGDIIGRRVPMPFAAGSMINRRGPGPLVACRLVNRRPRTQAAREVAHPVRDHDAHQQNSAGEVRNGRLNFVQRSGGAHAVSGAGQPRKKSQKRQHSFNEHRGTAGSVCRDSRLEQAPRAVDRFHRSAG